MAIHSIEPERRTLHGHFSRDLPPCLTIDSGDTVVFRTLDARWTVGLPESGKWESNAPQFSPLDPELDSGHAHTARTSCPPSFGKRMGPSINKHGQRMRLHGGGGGGRSGHSGHPPLKGTRQSGDTQPCVHEGTHGPRRTSHRKN